MGQVLEASTRFMSAWTILSRFISYHSAVRNSVEIQMLLVRISSICSKDKLIGICQHTEISLEELQSLFVCLMPWPPITGHGVKKHRVCTKPFINLLFTVREGFRKKNQKKCGPGAHFGGGGGSGKIFAGPQFYCDFWKIKPRW